MCKFCGGNVVTNEKLPIKSNSFLAADLTAKVDSRGYLIVELKRQAGNTDFFDSTGCKIKYCPMCGRNFAA